MKTGLSLGQRLYFNSIRHAPAFLNQQIFSEFNTEFCLHRLVVMYGWEGSVRQIGKWRHQRYWPQSQRIIFFWLGMAAEKCSLSDKESFRLWGRMPPADQHIVLKGSQTPIHSSLNFFSLLLDHFSDAIPHLEPDAAFQQHCASWRQRGDRSVPTRDRHRAVWWRCSGKLETLLNKTLGSYIFLPVWKQSCVTQQALNGWPSRMELSVTVVCSPETHFMSLQSCGLVFCKWILPPKAGLEKSEASCPHLPCTQV